MQTTQFLKQYYTSKALNVNLSKRTPQIMYKGLCSVKIECNHIKRLMFDCSKKISRHTVVCRVAKDANASHHEYANI